MNFLYPFGALQSLFINKKNFCYFLLRVAASCANSLNCNCSGITPLKISFFSAKKVVKFLFLPLLLWRKPISLSSFFHPKTCGFELSKFPISGVAQGFHYPILVGVGFNLNTPYHSWIVWGVVGVGLWGVEKMPKKEVFSGATLHAPTFLFYTVRKLLF